MQCISYKHLNSLHAGYFHMLFYCLLIFFYFFLFFFQKIISQKHLRVKKIWIHTRSDILLDLIWVQVVCKCFQEKTSSQSVNECFRWTLYIIMFGQSIFRGPRQQFPNYIVFLPFKNCFYLSKQCRPDVMPHSALYNTVSIYRLDSNK